MSTTRDTAVSFRYDVASDDPGIVRRMIDATGFFHPYETEIAVELVDDRLAKGHASDYHFVFAEIDGQTCGYTCYGEIGCTEGSYDLYWIAVDPSQQRRGLGRLLLAESERLIAERNGRHVYIETSNRPLYLPTRGFYLGAGYDEAAVLKDFYAEADDKVIYVKRLK